MQGWKGKPRGHAAAGGVGGGRGHGWSLPAPRPWALPRAAAPIPPEGPVRGSWPRASPGRKRNISSDSSRIAGAGGLGTCVFLFASDVRKGNSAQGLPSGLRPQLPQSRL